MKILCFGSTGLVASELKQWLPELSPESLVFLSHKDCDITSDSNLKLAFETHEPSIVINAAAFTAVDDAEGAVNKANQVNGHALKSMAKYCDDYDATLIHFSTDYVFNGKKDGAYEEDDPVSPINAYGDSKLLGEAMIQQRLAKHYILRIQWVYGLAKPNFVDAIINKAREAKEVSVIFDQVGSPTSAEVIAKAVVNLIHNMPAYGIYHFRTLNTTSWYEFASYFLQRMNIKVPIIPVASTEYKTAAKRPLNSKLNIAKWIYTDLYTPPNWKQAVDDYLVKKQYI